jgi:heme oxygenase
MSEARELFTHQLKIQTASLHEKLDHKTLLAKVMDPSFTLQEYSQVLTLLCESFALVENSILKAGGEKLFQDYFYESRVPDLKKDLDALKISPIHSAQARSCDDSSVATAVGMIYVLHGSSLGGQFIAKKLAGRMPEDALNFYGRSSHYVPAWAQFKEKLDHENNHLSLAQAVAGASHAFETFFQVLVRS